MSNTKCSDHILNAVHIVLDLETAGLNPGCPVLQIGAILSVEGEIVDQYYAGISLVSNQQFGLVTEQDTLDWWDKQDKELYAKVFGSTDDLVAVLHDFIHWIDSARDLYNDGQIYLWSKPARFDFPILETAYSTVGLKHPWNHREVMDLRTIFKLYANEIPEAPFLGTKHDALADALHQALHLNKLLERFSHG